MNYYVKLKFHVEFQLSLEKMCPLICQSFEETLKLPAFFGLFEL